MKLLALDGNSILNRAFYGINILTNKNGQYTNAIHGFIMMLNKLTHETTPDAIAIAFDMRTPTFRHKAFKGYKAGRKGMPSELACQLPVLKELLEYLGYAMVECEGFEADDILGTLAKSCEKGGHTCIIATGDRDSLQLVSNLVSVRITTTKCGKPSVTLYDEKKVIEEHGVTPKQLVDIKALQGDTSDNIPGVVGVGKKNALMLIQKYGSLDAVYDDIESHNIKLSIKSKIIEGKDSAYMSYKLGKICRSVPIERDIQKYVPKKINFKKAMKLMSKLELFHLIKLLRDEEILSREKSADLNDENLKIIYEDDFEKIKLLLLDRKKADFTIFYEGEKITIISFIIDKSIILVKERLWFDLFLKEILEDESIEKRTHGLKQLFHVAQNYSITPKNIVFDTMLAAYLLNSSSKNYDLERLYTEYGDGEPIRPITLWNAELLAAKQTKEFFKILDSLSKKIDENNQTFLLNEIEIPLAGVLSDMERTGFTVDKAGISEYGELLYKSICNLEKEIYESIGYEFNIRSPKQLGDALFKSLELPHSKETQRGYSTSADVLEKLRFMHPVVEKILEFRTISKIKSTYCDGMLKVVQSDGRIHTKFNQTEARTGRLSSMEPNLQNIPVKTELGKELRKFLRAREGWLLIDADYSQIELRILADMANDKNMLASFQKGEDIHSITASEIFHIPLSMVTSVMRNRAKAVNFGIIYGMGPFSLAKEIGVNRKEANDYINKYFAHYSDVKNYIDNTLKFAKEHGYVETKFGRRRYIPEILSTNFNLRSFGERVAMNMPIQGTAADIIKIAMIRVKNRIDKENLNAKLILQVHDELIVEAPVCEADKIAQLLENEMKAAAKLKVDLVAKAAIGKTWYDVKH
ncbi:MAG: DNA polymerase I [Oscillospiraceae bacterium]|nr:DNA polymerase I [Oscillospiraceae bacterium]